MELEKPRKLDFYRNAMIKSHKTGFLLLHIKYTFYLYSYIINQTLIRFFFLRDYYINSI